jgi:hypothetical protein
MRFFAVFVFLIGVVLSCKADEGMWLPLWLNKREIQKMESMGLQIPIDQLYHHHKPSVKDAIVSLDGGNCTGEFISDQGLLLTNHHCGMENIQEHTTVENNYLTNGFWAQSRDKELPNLGKTATILIRAIDISHLFESTLSLAKTETERASAIDSLSAIFIHDAIDSTKLDASVESFFSQSKFVLFLTKTYRDVRLVGVPPLSIGNFGGEIDNWQWPRHTGDFCLFRVYANANGEPADYSASNLPLKPKNFLKISINGYNENDFTLVMGYPGTTNRYASSAEVKSIYNSNNPIVDEVRTIKQNILKIRMQRSPQLAIKYAAKYDQSANYQKYANGQNLSIKKNNLVDQRLIHELALKKSLLSINDSVALKQLTTESMLIEQFDNVLYSVTLCDETLIGGPEILKFALDFLNALYELNSCIAGDSIHSKKKKDAYDIVEKHFKDYDFETDKVLFKSLLQFAVLREQEKNLQFKFLPENYKKKGVEVFVANLFEKTVFTQHQKLVQMIEGTYKSSLEKDEIMTYLYHVIGQYVELMAIVDAIDEMKNISQRHVFKAYNTIYPDSSFYPNANSTMRLTFGKVKSYEPKDGVLYNYYSTSDGLLAKYDSSVKEFNLLNDVKTKLEEGSFGQYGFQNKLSTCFITTNDITGGNSGSPVLNGKGELIGVAFDGNWEGMTSDLVYDVNSQRTICVDVRFVLWTIEYIGKAKFLLDEMHIN